MDVKVLEKTKDGLKVAVLPHNIPGFLPTAHLSDHVTNGPLLYHWLQTGDTLHRVLCLSVSEERVVSFTGLWGPQKWRWGSAVPLGGAQGTSGSGSALSWKLMGRSRFCRERYAHPSNHTRGKPALCLVSLVVIRARPRYCSQMLVVSAEWESRVLGRGRVACRARRDTPSSTSSLLRALSACPRAGTVGKYPLSLFFPPPLPC